MSENDNGGGGGCSRLPSAAVTVEAVFLVAAALLLFSMMTITFLDVIGRYSLSRPLGFAYEMTQLAMAGLVFTALPSVTLRGQHVTAGLFDTMFAGRVKKVRDLMIALLVAGGCAFLGWRMVLLARRFAMFGDETSVLQFPIALVAWLGVACLAAATVAGLVRAALVLVPERTS